MDAPLTFRLENVVKARQEVMEDFEGPLDLILDLLKRHKIEIQDLRISLLLEQYLLWMERRKSLDLEIASEFIAMASHLVYLKTKMLLTLGSPEEDEEVDELILALRERLRQEEYERARQAAAFLRERMDIGRGLLTRPMETLSPVRTYPFVHDKALLIGAVHDVGVRALRKTPPPVTVFERIVAPEKHPVGEKIGGILRTLREKGKTLFRALLKAGSRSETIAAFLAVLELCRTRRVTLSEEGLEYVVALRETEN
ncbi:MAG: segregation/condensation protein A [Oscillospiraceae bacterium]|nr:segregation/condensation protein A [Oscillospiraceae bacterium]